MKKPWLRKGRGYFVTLDNGKQVKLADTEEEAHDEWDSLRAAQLDGPDPFVYALIDEFLATVRDTQSAATFQWYSVYLASFAKEHATKRFGQLRRHHLTRWAEQFARGARVAAIRAVKRCFAWAADEEYVKHRPFLGVRVPSTGRRDVLLPQTDREKIMADVSNRRDRRPFRLVLSALALSGARPGEVRTVTAAHCSGDTWTFTKHKTDKTERVRVVHLMPCMQTITRILCHFRPTGPLFLNADGAPWTKGAITDRMRRLREKLGLPRGTVAYSLRHSYITHGMENGVDVATMAALTGTSVEMIAKHYGHLDQRREHLKRAALQATRPPKTEAP